MFGSTTTTQEAPMMLCTAPGCTHQIRYVPARDLPTLCADHAEDARRAAGTHHAHEDATAAATLASTR